MNNKENNISKIKNAILSSGIPLEYSVCKKLKQLDVHDFGEFLYERDNKTFSVDIHGFKFINFLTPNYEFTGSIDLLIECKYRKPNKKWYFTCFGDKSNTYRGYRSKNIFIDFPIREYIWESSKEKDKDYKTYLSETQNININDLLNSPIVHKGIEIVSNKEPNPNSISKSIYQLSYGTSKLISNEINSLIENEIPGKIFSFILPIVVTTADLYLMKEDITIEEIKRAKKYEDIFNQVDSVSYQWRIPNDIIKYTRNICDHGKRMWQTWEFINQNHPEPILDDLSIYNPSRFLIINYNTFEETLNSIFNNIEKATSKLIGRYDLQIDYLRKKGA